MHLHYYYDSLNYTNLYALLTAEIRTQTLHGDIDLKKES